jgi:hypothetical protein
MTGSSPGGVSPHQGRGRRGVLTTARAAVERLWHEVESVAEMLSDAGHGPRRWREKSDEPNPYAGIGPIPPDDRHPDEDA